MIEIKKGKQIEVMYYFADSAEKYGNLFVY